MEKQELKAYFTYKSGDITPTGCNIDRKYIGYNERDEFEDDCVKSFAKDCLRNLILAVKEKLDKLGYSFQTEDEFISFIHKRVSREIDPITKNSKLMLDKTTLITEWCDAWTYTHDPDSFTYTANYKIDVK